MAVVGLVGGHGYYITTRHLENPPTIKCLYRVVLFGEPGYIVQQFVYHLLF